MASDRAPEPAGRPDPDGPWWPVGVDEIAYRLGTTRGVVSMWRQRTKTWRKTPAFPAPDGRVSGRDFWWWWTVARWAAVSGRLPPEDEPPAGGPLYRPRA